MALPDSFFQIAGWALASLCAVLVVWALFWDRPRGRKLCPGCWYDLSGAPTDGPVVCPECGKQARSQRALRATRRRWRWALVAVCVLLPAAYVMSCVPRVRQGGAIGFVPTTALLLGLVDLDPERKLPRHGLRIVEPLAHELAERMNAGSLYGWQWRLLLHRSRAVVIPKRWPRGEPMLWRADLPRPLDHSGAGLWLEFPAKATYSASGSWPNAYRDMRVTLGPDDDHLDARIVVRSAVGQGWVDLWSTTKRYSIVQVETAEQAKVAFEGVEADEIVKNALQILIRATDVTSYSSECAVLVWLRPRIAELENTSLGIVVELRKAGQVVDSTAWSHFELEQPSGWIDMGNKSYGGDHWNPDGPRDMDQWTVRVRGSADVALADVPRERYWRGEFEVPLAEVFTTQR